jgi:predicted SnoaL-like aldol condensation-catalyzing enzyme
MNPIPATIANPPVVAGAKGDFVRLIFEQEKKLPRDPSRTYLDTSIDVLRMMQRTDKDPDDPSRTNKWNHFNVIRVENGLIKEHWDDFIVN